MCLYTKMVLNPKYKPSKKNGGNPPVCTDERTKYIPVSCGNCIECRKKKQREWRVRMLEEIKHDKTGKFVTLTFSEEALIELEIEAGTKEANTVATLAVRRFLERWRKEYRKSVKHWFITELGHRNTERVHIHGIIFTDKEKEDIQRIWKYGRTDTGYSMGERCVNYVMKYITKTDQDHKGFVGKILTSPGIGRGYIGSYNASKNKFNKESTNETYKLNNGCKIALPQYYRNKIYTEEEKEQLWISKIEKEELYVMGRKIRNINTERGQRELKYAIEYAKKISQQQGYGAGEGKKAYMTRKNGTKYLEVNRRIHNIATMFEESERVAKARIKHQNSINYLNSMSYEESIRNFSENEHRVNSTGRNIPAENEGRKDEPGKRRSYRGHEKDG
ncbi:replication initiation protein [Tortoise microvirus 19]|nr:replication initiation protein [Tortoise microvirus 19]